MLDPRAKDCTPPHAVETTARPLAMASKTGRPQASYLKRGRFWRGITQIQGASLKYKGGLRSAEQKCDVLLTMK